MENCTLGVTELTLEIQFLTDLAFFNSNSDSFLTSIASVLGVNSSRVQLLSAARRNALNLRESAMSQAYLSQNGAQGGYSLRQNGVTASINAAIPKDAAGSAEATLGARLGQQLASDGLPSGVVILGVRIACGVGQEPVKGETGQSCRSCSTRQYNSACASCSRHSKTLREGSFFITDCQCELWEGYVGPDGGPCFRNATLTKQVATDVAGAITGLTITVVSSNLLLAMFSGGGPGSSPVSEFSSSGTLTVISQVQFLNLVGRVGGVRASEDLQVFFNELGWYVVAYVSVFLSYSASVVSFSLTVMCCCVI
jgi:hypothetical protein